jgi:hypothetical protein
MWHGKCGANETGAVIAENPGGVKMRAKVGVLIVVLGLISIVLPLSAKSQVERPDIEFPYVLRIAEGNVLVVHGHVFRDSVVFTWRPDDSLRIEGMAVMPAPPVPPKTFTEEELSESSRNVPFIADRVKQGSTWREARNEFRRACLQVESEMLETYWAVMDSTGSPELARQAVLGSVDPSLFADGTVPRITQSSIRVTWQNHMTQRIPLGKREPFRPPDDEVPSPKEKAVRYTVSASRWLDRQGATPWVAVVDRRGIAGMSGSEAFEAIHQIEMAGHGQFVEGPLDEFTLEEIAVHSEGEKP